MLFQQALALLTRDRLQAFELLCCLEAQHAAKRNAGAIKYIQQ